MAGIGFNLQKMLKGDTYIDTLKAYFYSALIAAGPWIMSILTLFAIGLVSFEKMDMYELTYFRTAIIYVYAFSLIVVGLIQIGLTRYLADRLYLKEKESLVPAFISSSLLTLLVQSVIAFTFLWFEDTSLIIKFLIFAIYLTISMLWLVMIFLTALWDYRSILIAFLTGCVVTIGACWVLTHQYGLWGLFAGYFIGHFLIVVLLSARIFTEFGSSKTLDWNVFTFWANNKMLILLGLTYNLAIWIDKIVFWFSPNSLRVSQMFRTYPAYESASFFAYLTIIPALSFFLIEAETNFYRKYRAFYQEILDRGGYSAIQKRRQQISETLRRSLSFIVKYQGIISLIFIAFAPELTEALRMPWLKVPVFRIVVLGAFLHSLLLVTIIIVLYFDLQKLALLICSCFLITNGVFAYVSSWFSISFLGYGYFAATFISLVFGFYALDYHLKRLEFLTFASQPVGVHREEEIW